MTERRSKRQLVFSAPPSTRWRAGAARPSPAVCAPGRGDRCASCGGDTQRIRNGRLAGSHTEEKHRKTHIEKNFLHSEFALVSKCRNRSNILSWLSWTVIYDSTYIHTVIFLLRSSVNIETRCTFSRLFRNLVFQQQSCCTSNVSGCIQTAIYIVWTSILSGPKEDQSHNEKKYYRKVFCFNFSVAISERKKKKKSAKVT